MRISDWSSDVCSSDLAAAAAGHRARPRAGARTGAADRLRRAPAQQPARDAVPGARLGRAPARARGVVAALDGRRLRRSEEHTSELQSLMRISYAVFCLKKKTIEYNKCNNT